MIGETLGAPTQQCFISALPGSAASGTISGSGLALPLAVGAFTLTSQDCITSASAPYTPFLPPFSFGSSALVLRTDHGNINVEYSGTSTLQANGPLIIKGTFTIKGGTGRFADAAGDGTVEGAEDIGTNPARGLVVLSGRISY